MSSVEFVSTICLEIIGGQKSFLQPLQVFTPFMSWQSDQFNEISHSCWMWNIRIFCLYYERFPLFCESRKVVGHSIDKCKKYFNGRGIAQSLEDVIVVEWLVVKHVPTNIEALVNVVFGSCKQCKPWC